MLNHAEGTTDATVIGVNAIDGLHYCYRIYLYTC